MYYTYYIILSINIINTGTGRSTGALPLVPTGGPTVAPWHLADCTVAVGGTAGGARRARRCAAHRCGRWQAQRRGGRGGERGGEHGGSECDSACDGCAVAGPTGVAAGRTGKRGGAAALHRAGWLGGRANSLACSCIIRSRGAGASRIKYYTYYIILYIILYFVFIIPD